MVQTRKLFLEIRSASLDIFLEREVFGEIGQ